MDLQQLTKKNQEFVHIATNQLIKDGKTDTEIKDILAEALPVLLENQKKGLTGRAIFGAPTVWASSFTVKEEDLAKEDQEKNTNPWLMWLDTSLVILAFISFFNGVLGLFNQDTVLPGIFSILILGFSGGASFYALYHFIYRHLKEGQRPPMLKYLGTSFLAILAWFLIYALAAFIPSSLNPTVPVLGLLILAAAAFGGRYYLQKRYKVLSALTPINQQTSKK